MIKALPYIIEGLIALLAIAFVYAQVVLPYIRKTPFFPMFRPQPKVERQIEEVNEQVLNKELESELTERQRQLAKKK